MEKTPKQGQPHDSLPARLLRIMFVGGKGATIPDGVAIEIQIPGGILSIRLDPADAKALVESVGESLHLFPELQAERN